MSRLLYILRRARLEEDMHCFIVRYIQWVNQFISEKENAILPEIFL